MTLAALCVCCFCAAQRPDDGTRVDVMFGAAAHSSPRRVVHIRLRRARPTQRIRRSFQAYKRPQSKCDDVSRWCNRYLVELNGRLGAVREKNGYVRRQCPRKVDRTMSICGMFGYFAGWKIICSRIWLRWW